MAFRWRADSGPLLVAYWEGYASNMYYDFVRITIIISVTYDVAIIMLSFLIQDILHVPTCFDTEIWFGLLFKTTSRSFGELSAIYSSVILF